MKISRNTVIGFIIFVIVFIVYILTLCPSIYLGKSADHVLYATGLSIIKPVSNPLWLFVAKLFKLFSPSDPAWGLNLMSAFFGAWTVSILYIILANIGHDRTTEEIAKFSKIPHLKQICAIAGALLLAFCPVFWEASVIAGPNTLKSFLFVLSSLYLIKYLYLRKKRYILFFSLILGIGVANSATLLLFLPIVIIILLFKCREILEDPIVVLLCLILFFAGFIAFIYPIPRSYISNQPPYYTPTTLVQALSYSIEAYYYDLKSVFPAASSPLLLAMWGLFLIAPTFLPLLYLSWNKKIPSASMMPQSWSFIKFLMMLIFTIIGLIYLFGYDFYTILYRNIMRQLPPVYLVPMVIIAGWLSYIFGYWIIIMAGMRGEIHSNSEGISFPYRKPVYGLMSIILLILPFVSLTKNYISGDSAKNNLSGTIIKTFMEDVLSCCEPGSVIVLPEIIDVKGNIHGLGNVLAYVNAYHENSEETEISGDDSLKTVTIDLPEIRFLAVTNKIDMEKYLEFVIWRGKDSSGIPRQKPSEPEKAPYDRILQESLKYSEVIGKRKSNMYLLHNGMVFSPENELINAITDLIPTGLVYKVLPYGDPEFRAEDHIKKIRSLWAKFKLRDIKAQDVSFYTDEIKTEKRFSNEGIVLNAYSKLANDTGIFIGEQGISQDRDDLKEESTKFFELALQYDNDNASAMENLIQDFVNREGSEARIAEFRRKIDQLRAEQSKKVSELVSAGESIKDSSIIRETENVITTLRLMLVYGYIRDPEFFKKYLQLGFGAVIARASQEERLPYLALEYKMLNLAISMDPVNPELRVVKARRLQDTNIFLNKLQSIIEFQTAINNRIADKRRIYQEIASVYMRLNNIPPAEKYYKLAIQEPSLETDPLKIRQSDVTAKFLLLNLYASTKSKLEEGLNMAKEINADARENERDIFIRSVEAIFAFMIFMNKLDEIPAYVKEFAAKNPQWETEIKLSLATLYRRQGNLKEAGKIYEEIRDKVDDKDGTISAGLANLYFEQKEWEKILALPMKATEGIPIILSGFYLRKGQAYLMTGQVGSSIDEYTKALKYYDEADANSKSIANFNRNHILNELAWSYYLRGIPVKETPEGKYDLDQALKISLEVYDNTRRTQISSPAILLLWETYAWILYRHTESKHEAFQIMQKVYIGNPDHSQVAFHYGVMLYEKKRIEEGLELIKQGYLSGKLFEIEEKEAEEIFKSNNITLPEKQKDI